MMETADTSELVRMMEKENFLKEFEPDANEIIFGQKTPPNRPLTEREASKRKKIILKLIDQKLKFKLIELMKDQVEASAHHDEPPAMTIPTISQAISDCSSQPLYSYEGNWQQRYRPVERQSSMYPQQYGPDVGASWHNSCSFQSPTQSNFFPAKLKQKAQRNRTLVCSTADAIGSSGISHPTPSITTPIFDAFTENSRTKKLKKTVEAYTQEDNNFARVPTDGAGLWHEIYKLTESILRTEVNRVEPLSSYEQKLQQKIMIQMATNPDTLRSNKSIAQFLSQMKVLRVISKAKMILQQVHRSDPQVGREFRKLKYKSIRELKALNDVAAVRAVRAIGNWNVQVIQTKIGDLIGPLLNGEVDETQRKQLISKLRTNPRSLETSELPVQPITNIDSVMREIKRILDEHTIVRPGKRFHIPLHRYIDGPFVVAVRCSTETMSVENTTTIRDALIAHMDGVVLSTNPKIIDPRFGDDGSSLVMVCANRQTLDLTRTFLATNFTGRWTVTPIQIKNPLSKSDLKTVRMNFNEPQFFHFNQLMVQLKIDNPSLFVRRWELRQPPKGPIDTTECLYVGVDFESLGCIEQMNRTGNLLQSTVTFEICYDECERNYLPNPILMRK